MVAKDLIDFNIPPKNKENKISKVSESKEEFECTRSPFVVSEGYNVKPLEGEIIENSDAQIIDSQMSVDFKNNDKICLTLELNKEDISHLISILKFSGYQIKKYFSTHVNHGILIERYNSLMNYLKYNL